MVLPDTERSVPRLLEDLREGRREAFDDLFPLVYRTLHQLAHRRRSDWQGNLTLNTTALVHEAYLKLVGQRRTSWETEAHFLATAARAIRHILINYARDRRTQKRGGDWQAVSLNEKRLPDVHAPGGSAWDERVMTLESALGRLAGHSERQSRVVECRFFAGMTVEQTATALGLSTATVTRDWAMARAWLHRELSDELA